MSYTETTHSFGIEIAMKYGIEQAILIHHFKYWIKLNRRKNSEKHFKEGRWWTYQKRSEIQAHIPYLTEESIRHHCEELVKKNVLIKKNFNKSKIDKTLWYAFVDESEFLGTEDSNNVYERGKPQSTGENPNRGGENPNAIPDTITTDTEKDILRISKKRKKVSPTPRVEREPGVFTTDQEHAKLLERFGERELKERYFEVSRWKGKNGVGGGDDYATIIKWVINQEKVTPRAEIAKENKDLATKALEKFPHISHHVEIKEKCIVFAYTGCYEDIYFEDNGFKERLFSRLRKMNLSPEAL
jgi:hypothetical protein